MAYRWFWRLGLDGDVPDHSTFSKNRHGRFRDSDLLRRLFETVLTRCIEEGLVGGEGFAVDGSLIRADASRQKGVEPADWSAPSEPSRAVEEYLAVLDDAAFSAATAWHGKGLRRSRHSNRQTAPKMSQTPFCTPIWGPVPTPLDRGAGVAVVASGGKTAAAISIAIPASLLNPKRAAEIATEIRTAISACPSA